jgi:hypothetical protein
MQVRVSLNSDPKHVKLYTPPHPDNNQAEHEECSGAVIENGLKPEFFRGIRRKPKRLLVGEKGQKCIISRVDSR